MPMVKVLFSKIGKATTRYKDELLFYIVQDRMSKIYLMFRLIQEARKITRELRKRSMIIS